MATGVKEAIKEGVLPKGKKATVKAKSTTVKATTKEVSDKVENQTGNLPKEKQGVYITATQTGEAKPIKVRIEDIKATSQQVYVNDIHSANPEILAKNLYVIMPNTAHVVLRLSEKQYNELLAMKEAKKIRHLYSVVDNATYPSLTYGSWMLDEIVGELPDLDQIADYDEKFKKMDVFFHNHPVYGELAATSIEDDEELEIDFSDDEDDEENEEDFEIDFSEED